MSHDQNFKNLILDYLACALSQIPAREHLGSDNLVARLNLPNMAYPPEEKIDVYAQAVRGLLQLEPDPEKRLKYVDFIDIYSELDDNQRKDYATRYPREAAEMSGFAERFVEQGKQQGIQQGIQRGIQQGIQQATREGLQHQRHMLTRQVHRRFGSDVAEQSEPLLSHIADPQRLDDLAEVLLDSPDGASWLRALRVAAG